MNDSKDSDSDDVDRIVYEQTEDSDQSRFPGFLFEESQDETEVCGDRDDEREGQSDVEDDWIRLSLHDDAEIVLANIPALRQSVESTTQRVRV